MLLLKTRDPRLLVTLRQGKLVEGDPRRKWMSQRQVASALNISAGYYADLENGNRSPSYDVGLRIANFYGVSLEALFEKEALEFGQPA